MQKRQANPKLPSTSLILIGSCQGTDGKRISSLASVRDCSSSCSVTADTPSTMFCSRQVTREWIVGDTAVTRQTPARTARGTCRIDSRLRTDARGRDGGVRQEAGDGNRPPRHWQKKTPHRGRMRGLFGYPSSLLDGERRRQGVAKRPPLPAEMSDALTVTSNATIVCSIPDSLVRISLRWPALPLARPLVRSGAAPWMAKRAGLENCAVGLPKRYP